MNRNRALTLSAIALAATLTILSAGVAVAVPAFPGAEGHGAIATGGRGGRAADVDGARGP